MAVLILGALTIGEWIVAIVSAVLTLLFLVPVVWLSWRFLQMSDGAVARTIDEVQRFAEVKDRSRQVRRGQRLAEND